MYSTICCQNGTNQTIHTWLMISMASDSLLPSFLFSLLLFFFTSHFLCVTLSFCCCTPCLLYLFSPTHQLCSLLTFSSQWSDTALLESASLLCFSLRPSRALRLKEVRHNTSTSTVKSVIAWLGYLIRLLSLSHYINMRGNQLLTQVCPASQAWEAVCPL